MDGFGKNILREGTNILRCDLSIYLTFMDKQNYVCKTQDFSSKQVGLRTRVCSDVNIKSEIVNLGTLPN